MAVENLIGSLDDFEKFIVDPASSKIKKFKKATFLKTVVLKNKEWILSALEKRYSLYDIYIYFLEKKIIDRSVSYSSFYGTCRRTILFSTGIRNKLELSLDEKTDLKCKSNNKSKDDKGALGLPKNSFDNWNGDSRDFVKDLL